MGKTDSEQFTAAEARRRQEAILRGAFAGPPTQLKDIPTKRGESRSLTRKKAKTRSNASRPRPSGP
jgi:hypothetical protein